MLSKILIAGPHLSGLGLLGHSVTVGNVNSSKGYAIESTIIIVGFICHTKDEFIIEPQYAHKKNLNKSEKNNHILETDHPRALKLEKFLFFLGFFVKLFT